MHLYGIACACGFESLANYVARNAELETVKKLFQVREPRLLTLSSYHNLVSYLTERDYEWHRLLATHQLPFDPDCRCDALLVEGFREKVMQNLRTPYLQTNEIYSKVLRDLPDQIVDRMSPVCGNMPSHVKAFIKAMASNRDVSYAQLTNEKWYVQ